MRSSVLALLLVGCASVGTGDDNQGHSTNDGNGTTRPPVTFHKDGTVEAGQLKFSSVKDFQHSDEFVQNGRRCASDRVPENYRAAPTDCSMTLTRIQAEYGPDAVFTIPVVFHVIQKTDGTGAISDALLQSQIEILNEDYGALTGTPGAGSTAGKIRFVLATKKPDGSPTNGIEHVTNNSYFVDPGSGLSPMKNALHWDTAHYFNLYTNDANGALGYATFPSESAGDAEDGVVLLYTSVGRNAPQGGEYNMGRTATHEVGHYLGLFHTFQGGCGSTSNPYGSGDLLKDTTAHPEPNFECTPAPSSCGGGNLPLENFMNYTPDACMTKFSTEQVNRMRCSIINYRADLVSIDTGNNTAPVASFTATATNLAVTFVDHSTDSDGTIASRAWSFGDGGTSTAASPSHTYAAAGTYTVSLTVKDNTGETATHSQDVTVSTGGTTPPASGALTSGTAVTNLAAGTGADLAYTIEVPAGATALTIHTSGGTGDADLYVKKGSAPTTSTYDGRGYNTGNDETVRIDNPAAGRYYVNVHGYAAFTGITLLATVTAGGGASSGFDHTEANLTAATDEAKTFSVDVPAGATGLTFTISSGTGDADLYVKKGAAPTTTSYDQRPYLEGNAESVVIAQPTAGTYYVMVRAYAAYSGVSLRVTYE